MVKVSGELHRGGITIWPNTPLSSPMDQNRGNSLRNFLGTASSQVRIISPYMSQNTLNQVVGEIPDGVDTSVVCSWRKEDILSGFVDLNVYKLCQEKGFELRVDLGDPPTAKMKVHIKAYVVDDYKAMIGSANLTKMGMSSNIESLVNIEEGHDDWAELMRSYLRVGRVTRVADDELYQYVKNFQEQLKLKSETEDDDRIWDPPGLQIQPLESIAIPVHMIRELKEEILNAMPPIPKADDLYQSNSFARALDIRGLRFGNIRKITREYLSRATTELFSSSKDREKFDMMVDDYTTQVMEHLCSQDDRLDIQRRPHASCLVWKVHHIINLDLYKYLEPYIGKPFKDIGLEEKYWEDSFLGDATKKLRRISLNLLPPEIAGAIDRLTTYPATIYVMSSGKARYPKPVGAPVILTDEGGKRLEKPIEELLTADRILHETWFPSFCLYEPVEGKNLGDSIFQGLVFWECDRSIREKIEEEIAEDVKTLKSALDPIKDDHPFRREKHSEVIFTKIASYKGRDKYPLGHPRRTMKRYVTKRLLTSILNDVSIRDH